MIYLNTKPYVQQDDMLEAPLFLLESQKFINKIYGYNHVTPVQTSEM